MYAQGGHAQDVDPRVSIQPLHRLATVRNERISRRTITALDSIRA